MGSGSDLATMRHAAETLESLQLRFEIKILSAHRTPEAVTEWTTSARARGIQAIIAAAGGAAHLAGVVAAQTTLPVLAVPIQSVLNGVDSLYSMVQMPGGIPVATFAIGKAGAVNAALFSAAIVALSDKGVAARLETYRADMKKKALGDNAKLEKAFEGRAEGTSISAVLTGAGFKVD